MIRPFVRCLIAAMFAAPLAQVQLPAQSPPPHGPATVSSFCGTTGTYDQLTEPWRTAPPQNIPLGTAPAELTLQATQFSDQPVPEKIGSIPEFCAWSTVIVGVHVSTAGEVSSFATGEGSVRGSGGGKLPPQELTRLESLMDDLPSDGRRIPPPDRRVLVVAQRNGSTVRLYDSGNLPNSVIDIIPPHRRAHQNPPPTLQPDQSLRPGEINAIDPASGKSARLTQRQSQRLNHRLPRLRHQDTHRHRGRQNRSRHSRGLATPRLWRLLGQHRVQPRWPLSPRLVGKPHRSRSTTPPSQPVTDSAIFPQHLKEYLHSPD